MANSTDIKLLDILRNDNVAKMEEYLNNGGNPDYFINRGEVPLNLARSKEMAQLLIDKGANFRMHTRGRTPIIWQAMRSNPEVIKVLLNHDPKLIYDRAGLSEDRETLLHKCVLNGSAKSLECIKILLAHKPAIDINGVTDDGDTDEAFTPLDYAVHTNNPFTRDIIILLIENGAVRRDTRPTMYDDFVNEYLASKLDPRNVQRGITSELTYNDIEEGNAMVNFPTNNTKTEYNFKRYYKNSPQIRGMPTHPQTRKVLKPTNFKRYRAHLVNNIILGNNPLSAINTQSGGKKTRRKALKKKTRKTRK